MAVSAGVAIGTGLAAGVGATAAAIRAVKQNTKPNRTPYGSSEDVYGAKNPQLQDGRWRDTVEASYQNNVRNLGPRPVGDDLMTRKAQNAWDKKKQALDSARSKSYDYNQKLQDEKVLEKTGYEVATEPLLGMQEQGAQHYNEGRLALANTSAAAEQQRQIGLGLNATAAQDQAMSQFGNQGSEYLAGYQPGAISQAMSRQVLDQNAQANLGAARASGALGLRNALNANAFTGVQAAGQMATQAAQEQERYLAARVGQANIDRETQIQAEEAQRQRVLQQQALGLGVAQNSLGTGLQAATTYGNQAIQREQTAAAGLDSIRQSQLEADMNYDQRRQAEGQRKSDRLWGLAGGLIGVAGSALGRLGGK